MGSSLRVHPPLYRSALLVGIVALTATSCRLALDGAGTGTVGTPPVPAAPSPFTAAGVPLPSGWSLKVSDRFGTGAGRTVTAMTDLHAKYFEGQFYNRDAGGLVLLPNVVINHEQQTYRHFEDVIAFSSDHLTIQARGHQDGSISSGEMVSRYTARSFCVEGRYRIPNPLGAWPAFWVYGSASGSDTSELDVEQPITPNQGVAQVSFYNHPAAASVSIADPSFTTQWMTWSNGAFDASAAPHAYTICYDDTGSGTTSRYIDGRLVYTATWKWNASLGGTGHGPDATTIANLAVGGDWPGNVASPSTFTADFDVYSIEYYGP